MSKLGTSQNSYKNNYLLFNGFKNTTTIIKPEITKNEEKTEKQCEEIEKQCEVIEELIEINNEAEHIPNLHPIELNEQPIISIEHAITYDEIYKTSNDDFTNDLKNEEELKFLINEKTPIKMADVVSQVIKNIREKKQKINGWTL